MEALEFLDVLVIIFVVPLVLSVYTFVWSWPHPSPKSSDFLTSDDPSVRCLDELDVCTTLVDVVPLLREDSMEVLPVSGSLSLCWSPPLSAGVIGEISCVGRLLRCLLVDTFVDMTVMLSVDAIVVVCWEFEAAVSRLEDIALIIPIGVS